MERHEFFIQGSADEPYRIEIRLEAGRIIALCSCPAGVNGQYCKHRIGILTGDAKICTDLDMAAVATVRGWLPGSALEAAMQAVAMGEVEAARAQAKVKALKKQLARVLYGHT
jgi:hypothetical protein